jgi:hypothetical protein
MEVRNIRTHPPSEEPPPTFSKTQTAVLEGSSRVMTFLPSSFTESAIDLTFMVDIPNGGKRVDGHQFLLIFFFHKLLPSILEVCNGERVTTHSTISLK